METYFQEEPDVMVPYFSFFYFTKTIMPCLHSTKKTSKNKNNRGV